MSWVISWNLYPWTFLFFLYFKFKLVRFAFTYTYLYVYRTDTETLLCALQVEREVDWSGLTLYSLIKLQLITCINGYFSKFFCNRILNKKINIALQLQANKYSRAVYILRVGIRVVYVFIYFLWVQYVIL